MCAYRELPSPSSSSSLTVRRRQRMVRGRFRRIFRTRRRKTLKLLAKRVCERRMENQSKRRTGQSFRQPAGEARKNPPGDARVPSRANSHQRRTRCHRTRDTASHRGPQSGWSFSHNHLSLVGRRHSEKTVPKIRRRSGIARTDGWEKRDDVPPAGGV